MYNSFRDAKNSNAKFYIAYVRIYQSIFIYIKPSVLANILIFYVFPVEIVDDFQTFILYQLKKENSILNFFQADRSDISRLIDIIVDGRINYRTYLLRFNVFTCFNTHKYGRNKRRVRLKHARL